MATTLTSLPGDLIRLIAGTHLSFPEIYQVALVSKYLYRQLFLNEASTYWRTLFEKFLTERRVPASKLRTKFLKYYQIKKLPMNKRIQRLSKLGYEKILLTYHREYPKIFTYCCQYGHLDLVKIIYELSIMIYENGPINNYMLKSMVLTGYYYACEAGNLEIVKYIMSLDLHGNFINQNRALMLAASSGVLPLIEYILSLNFTDINAGLKGAARGKRYELIHYFMNRGATNVNAGLRGAAMANSIELLKYFEYLGANDYTTALRSACIMKARTAMDYLVSRGAQITSFILSNVVRFNDLELLKRYITLATLSRVTINLFTVLRRATQKKYISLVKYLLEIGEYSFRDLLNEMTGFGSTDLELIDLYHEKIGKIVPQTTLEKSQMKNYPNRLFIDAIRFNSKELLKKYLDLGATDILGALHQAIFDERKIVEYLVQLAKERNLDVTLPYSQALNSAIIAHRDDLVDKLLKDGVKVTELTLHRGVQRRDINLVKRLLTQNKVDTNFSIKSLTTTKEVELMKLLLEHNFPLTGDTVRYLLSNGTREILSVYKKYYPAS